LRRSLKVTLIFDYSRRSNFGGYFTVKISAGAGYGKNCFYRSYEFSTKLTHVII
jgi:hypothetical protein